MPTTTNREWNRYFSIEVSFFRYEKSDIWKDQGKENGNYFFAKLLTSSDIVQWENHIFKMNTKFSHHFLSDLILVYFSYSAYLVSLSSLSSYIHPRLRGRTRTMERPEKTREVDERPTKGASNRAQRLKVGLSFSLSLSLSHSLSLIRRKARYISTGFHGQRSRATVFGRHARTHKPLGKHTKLPIKSLAFWQTWQHDWKL